MPGANDAIVSFEEIRKHVSSIKSDADKLQGRLDEALRAMRKEFAVGSVDEANATADKIEGEIETLQAEVNVLVAQLQELYNGMA